MDFSSLVLKTYLEPERITHYGVSDWNLLIDQGYASGLLARLYYLFEQANLVKYIPTDLAWHFSSASEFVRSYQHDVLIEVNYINQALQMAGQKPIYLKGVAYILAGDEASQGRLFSDIDIFVNRESLPSVERFLHWNGWRSSEIDAYDEKYYREWMHEIPALTHQKRGSTIDVHHNLSPKTSKITILADQIESNADSEYQVLAPEDRILHSIIHLLSESEFDKGLRDLTDIDMLLEQHQQETHNFITLLVERAFAIGAELFLFYTLRYLTVYFGRSYNQADMARLASVKPSWWALKFLDKHLARAVLKPISIDGSIANQVSHFYMFLRGHWLKMPLHILLPHLLRKAFIAPFTKKSSTAE